MDSQPPRELLIDLYRTMARIRACEESLVAPILSGEIRCPVHLYTGEEAVAAGVCRALSREDLVFGTHRSHGHYLAKGGDLKALVAEIYGRETGCSRGRGGSMHVTAPEVGVAGTAPIVAGTISLALGAALAAHIRADGGVAVSFFGDGAAGEGVLYETLNFAGLHRLPLLLVCENNLYSTHLPIGECRAEVRIHRIGRPLGVRSRRVDGNDVLRVYATACEAVARCRAGEGPALIEAMTYRFRGHVGPDDNVQGSHFDIRPPEEVTRWRRRDPLKRFESRLVRQGAATRGELAGIRKTAEDEVAAAHAFAKASPHPKEEDLSRDVFAI